MYKIIFREAFCNTTIINKITNFIRSALSSFSNKITTICLLKKYSEHYHYLSKKIKKPAEQRDSLSKHFLIFIETIISNFFQIKL